ncbi:MAG: carbohydrate porin [Terriglobales bacterium]
MLRQLAQLAFCLLATCALPAQSLFGHPLFLGGQINYIFQQHGAFPAAFSGPNSLVSNPEDALSRVLTFPSGVQAGRHDEFLFDLEETGGQGLSTVLGMAGFTNLDAVRNPQLGTAPYVARLFWTHQIALGDGESDQQPGFLATFRRVPRRRLLIHVGKFSLPDFFDLNAVGGDSHLQFMNWTIDQNGAYDYAADTRGYTVGAVVEYEAPSWSARFAETLMPKVANGIDLQWNLSRARSENLEFEYRPQAAWWKAHPATFRVLGYANLANMGVYRNAVNAFLAGATSVPDITAHPFQPRRKPGFGLNLEQQLAPGITAFARAGWADGRYESFAYTEVEQTVAGGVTILGDRWRRPRDRAGLAAVVNGISGDHRRYLALGGVGFLLGDGGLRYGHERIAEAFYTLHWFDGVFLSPDLQYVVNPGYDSARGPVGVTSARLHVDF